MSEQIIKQNTGIQKPFLQGKKLFTPSDKLFQVKIEILIKIFIILKIKILIMQQR